ncbi:Epoxide hydrolase 3 [Bienertia sinuspersici]
MKIVREKLGFEAGVCADGRGRSRGLALLWRAPMKVAFLSYSLHHIDCIVRQEEEDKEWRFLGVYGWHEGSSKHLTWELLEDLKPRSDLPWLVGGDLNKVFYNFEKKGGGTKNQSVLESFREACQGCDLWDVNYLGYPYTWWNGREGDDAVEERLDRFLASSS